MKKVLFIILFIILLTPKYVLASTSIQITNKIENISNEIDSTITYKIIPHVDNPKGVTNDLNSYTLDFKDTEVIDNTITKVDEIDFSNVIYTIPGTYKYGIRQENTSDIDLNIKKKNKEITVIVTKELDDSIKVDVQPLVLDFEDLEKKELEYTNEVKYTNISIEQKTSGDYKDFDKNTYFKYKITFYGKIGSKYTITGQDEHINYNGEKIDTSIKYEVKDTEKENYTYIYLKEGQIITIGLNESGFNELPHNMEYAITKVDGEKWSTKINGKERNSITLRVKDDENKIVIDNHRDYDDAVTGLMYNLLPFILVIFIIIGLYLVYKKIKFKKM